MICGFFFSLTLVRNKSTIELDLGIIPNLDGGNL